MKQRARKITSLWLFIDGKKWCDVIAWAMAANVDKEEAVRRLTEIHKERKLEFKVAPGRQS